MAPRAGLFIGFDKPSPTPTSAIQATLATISDSEIH
jgi:hypothetical protein